MSAGGVIKVAISQQIVVTVTPIISFSSTEKLFGNINSNPKATKMKLSLLVHCKH